MSWVDWKQYAKEVFKFKVAEIKKVILVSNTDTNTNTVVALAQAEIEVKLGWEVGGKLTES